MRLRRRSAAVVALGRFSFRQTITRGRSGLNLNDHDIAVLKIPLDIGSPPLSC